MQDLINCHCVGVDSIILNENPIIRLFIANPNHELWRNDTHEWSVALHAHHCDITIVPILGFIYNKIETSYGIPTILNEYQYESFIKGCGSFKSTFNNRSFRLRSELLTRSIKMGATDRHTIIVNKGHSASWIIIEGQENYNYNSNCYSNVDLTKFSFEGLYQPMSKEYRENKLKELSML